MNYDWYKIFNQTEFEATGLVSRTYEYFLSGVGLKKFLVTKGNYVSITVDDLMLSVNMSAKNPFEIHDRAIYIDENDDVWYGVLNEG